MRDKLLLMPQAYNPRMKNLASVLSQLRSERDRLNQAIAALEGVSINGLQTFIREAHYVCSRESPDCSRAAETMGVSESEAEEALVV